MPFIQKYLNILSNFSHCVEGIILPVTEVGGNNKSVQKHYSFGQEGEIQPCVYSWRKAYAQPTFSGRAPRPSSGLPQRAAFLLK